MGYVIILSEQKRIKTSPKMGITVLDTFKQDQNYISVDPLEGFISIPSRLDSFKQTRFRVQRVNRNDGTKENPLVRLHDEYSLCGFCTKKL